MGASAPDGNGALPQTPALPFPAPFPPLAGGDRFRFVAELGRGGMGAVYRVHDATLGRDVALKVLLDRLPEAIYRIKREFRALSQLNHPNLIELHELVVRDDSAFFTMELVEGLEFVAHVRRAGGADLAELARCTAELAEGVRFLHASGRVHRDIKPPNVLVGRDGRVVLLDFGLLTTQTSEPYTSSRSGDLVGTLSYIAPECLAGARATETADWYAVGVVLYEAVTGTEPFQGSLVDVLDAKQRGRFAPLRDVPEPFASIVANLLRPEPKERWGYDAIVAALGRDPAPGVPAAQAADPAFVGRQEELARMRSLREVVGRPRVLLVQGSSGIGKTRLVERFLEEAEAQGDLVLRSRCRPSESVPYLAFDGIVDVLSRFLATLPDDEAAAVFVPEPALVRLFPVLARLVRPGATATSPSGVALHELRRTGVAALRDLLRQVAARRRVILSIDDAHWASADSAFLLRVLLEPPDAPPALLIMTSRSELREQSPLVDVVAAIAGAGHEDRFTLEEIALDALSTEEIRDLCGPLLREPGVVETIVREARGSPFFAGQLCGLLVERHDPNQGPAWASRSGIMNAQIDALPPEVQRLLAFSSLAARPLPRRVLLDLMGDQEQGTRALGTLRRERLVREALSGGVYCFEVYHDRIREAVDASLEDDARQSLHEALATLLEKEGADARDLVRHFLGAGRPEAAAPHAATAGREALASLEFEGAIHYLRMAVTHGRWSEENARTLRRDLAESLANVGRSVDSAEMWLAAASVSEGGDASQYRRRAAALLVGSGHLERGYAILGDVLRAAGLALPSTPLRAALRLLWLFARVRLRGLHLGPARPPTKEEEERIDLCWDASAMLSMIDTVRGAYFQALNVLVALGSGDRYRIARALGIEAAYRAATGRHDHARVGRVAEVAQRAAADAGVPHGIAVALSGAATVAFMEGRWRQALEQGLTGDRIYREQCVGVTWERAAAATLISLTYLRLGELGAARATAQAAALGALDRGDLFVHTCLATAVMARLHLADDAPALAQQTVDEAMSQWHNGGFHSQDFWAYHARISVALYRGDLEAADAAFAELWRQLWRSLSIALSDMRIESRGLQGRIALGRLAGGPRRAAARAALSCARALDRERPAWAGAMAAAFRGAVAAARDDWRRASRYLEEAERAYTTADMPLDAAVCRWRRAELGDPAAEAPARAAAEQTLRDAGIVRPQVWVDAMLPMRRPALPPAAAHEQG